MEGKIYKICSENGDKVYIGSTIQKLSRRMNKHKSIYKMWKANNTYHTMSCILFDEYGVDKCNIVLLEEFSCETKQELREKEAHYIKTLKCVNKNIPLRTLKEWRQENQEHMKAYYQANKEKHKEYLQANKEHRLEQQKAYRQENKEKIKEQQKEWYRENKEKKRKEYLQANEEKLKEQRKERYQARKAKVSSQPV